MLLRNLDVVDVAPDMLSSNMVPDIHSGAAYSFHNSLHEHQDREMEPLNKSYTTRFGARLDMCESSMLGSMLTSPPTDISPWPPANEVKVSDGEYYYVRAPNVAILAGVLNSVTCGRPEILSNPERVAPLGLLL